MDARMVRFHQVFLLHHEHKSALTKFVYGKRLLDLLPARENQSVRLR